MIAIDHQRFGQSPFLAWQKVYNVGFRIVGDLSEQQTLAAQAAK